MWTSSCRLSSVQTNLLIIGPQAQSRAPYSPSPLLFRTQNSVYTNIAPSSSRITKDEQLVNLQIARATFWECYLHAAAYCLLTPLAWFGRAESGSQVSEGVSVGGVAVAHAGVVRGVEGQATPGGQQV